MRALAERDIEKYLVNRVKQLGGEVRKVKWIGRNSAPDRLVMVSGFPSWWIELKAPGKKATPAQLREHARMRNNKMCVMVIDSLEAVDELLGVV